MSSMGSVSRSFRNSGSAFFVLVLFGLLSIGGGLVLALRPAPPHTPFTITWVGDTYVGDRAEQMLQEHGYGWAFEHLPDFSKSDLAVLNVETPITNRDEFPEGYDIFYGEESPTARYHIFTSRGRVTRYLHRSSPKVAQVFADRGFSVATLGNNHALDQGPGGLEDTIRSLRDAGVAPIGAGLNIEEAARPYLVDTPFGRVAIFSFGKEVGTAPNATAESAGIFALNLENVTEAKEVARRLGAKFIVAAVHWGSNYVDDIDEGQKAWARRFANRGWHLVIGHGPHLAQPIEVVARTPVIYSLGNFVFGTRGRYTKDKPGYSLAVTTVLGHEGFRELRVACLMTDNMLVHYQPRECTQEESQQIMGKVSPLIDLQEKVGIFRW